MEINEANMYEIIKPGDLIFSRDNSLISKIVRIRTLSQWSHCGIVIGRIHGSINCISARMNGITTDKLGEWGNEVQILRIKDATQKQIDDIINFTIVNVGIKYGYCGLLDLMTMRNHKETKRWSCSEFIYKAILSSGIDLFDGKKPPQFVTVGHLYENPRLKFITELR